MSINKLMYISGSTSVHVCVHMHMILYSFTYLLFVNVDV